MVGWTEREPRVWREGTQGHAVGGQRGNLGCGGWPEREPRVWWVAREGT